MGWRFRKSFSPFPGVRFNFSPSGISTSIGVGPARVYIGPRGAAVSARVPGTGISFRQPIGVPNGGSLTEPTPIPASATSLPHRRRLSSKGRFEALAHRRSPLKGSSRLKTF